MKTGIFLITLIIFTFTTAGYGAYYILNINSFGIYDAKKVQRSASDNSLTGYDSESLEQNLLTETNIIYIDDMEPNHYLGLNFSVDKFSNAKFKPFKKVVYTMKIKTPPLTNPETGETKSEFIEEVKWLSGVPDYRGYIFSEDWEKQPGEWRFEFYYKNQLFSYLSFIVKAGKAKDDLLDGEFIYNKRDLDKKPEFPGGKEKLTEFIETEYVYPESALINGQRGRITMGMNIEKNGQLTDFHIIQGGYKTLEEEAKRILKKMPNWKAGEIDGKPVRSRWIFTIEFNFG